ncbi:MAG: PDZ domain-containing protein [Oscillospiraceae bacterium]|nr:PDZ domain-containing protein [Oscillospiraceae bacterium]
MKRFFSAIALAVVLLVSLPVQAEAAELLIPVGRIIGLQLQNDIITVAAYDDALGSGAREAGLKIGDEILKIDSREVSCAEDVRSALRTCGETVALTVRRGSRLDTIEMEPQQTEDGPRLGVYLRQGIAGIGTVTFYDPETGTFGTLGHGVSDARGALLQMTRGSAYGADILSVKKGKSGEPGQLKGSAQGPEPFGTLLRNTPQGVFGITKQGWKGEPMPVAAYAEISTGPAVIRSQVAGDSVQEYSVELLKIYPETRSDGRNFLLRITDPALLETTGGIVQGMSGSPIIQDGKLVGAVTHVLVNDPTRGYGIFIENMLTAAS